jgi:hypothetical protein
MLLIRDQFSFVNTDRFFFHSHCALPPNRPIFQNFRSRAGRRFSVKNAAAAPKSLLPRGGIGAIG